MGKHRSAVTPLKSACVQRQPESPFSTTGQRTHRTPQIGLCLPHLDIKPASGTTTFHHSGMRSAGGQVYELATFRPCGKFSPWSQRTLRRRWCRFLTSSGYLRAGVSDGEMPSETPEEADAFSGPRERLLALQLQPECFCLLLTCCRLNAQSRGRARTTRIELRQSRTECLRELSATATSAWTRIA